MQSLGNVAPKCEKISNGLNLGTFLARFLVNIDMSMEDEERAKDENKFWKEDVARNNERCFAASLRNTAGR